MSTVLNDTQERAPKARSAKRVGMVFLLITDRDTSQRLTRIAELATIIEWSLWREYFRQDPARGDDVLARWAARHRGERFEKFPPFKLETVDGERKPSKWCGENGRNMLADLRLMSTIGDAIAQQTFRLYNKQRWELLTGLRSLPRPSAPRIRFRDGAVVFRRSLTKPEHWIDVGFNLEKDRDILWLPVNLRAQSAETVEWLRRCADGEATPSGGMISRKKRKNRWQWQVTQARERMAGERETVDAIPDRRLICWADTTRVEFLTCRVSPVKGRPWQFAMESNDLVRVKLAAERDRRTMGRNYAQSPDGAGRGHGRQRAIAGKRPFAERYENRVKSWIEQRSAWLVREARELRCAELHVEDLTKRRPSELKLGSFPYARLLERIEQKAEEAGILFVKVPSLDDAKEMVEGEVTDGHGS